MSISALEFHLFIFIRKSVKIFSAMCVISFSYFFFLRKTHFVCSSVYSLILSNRAYLTVRSYNDPEEEGLWKHWGKRRKIDWKGPFYYNPTKPMFSEVYWNQHVCPSMCLCNHVSMLPSVYKILRILYCELLLQLCCCCIESLLMQWLYTEVVFNHLLPMVQGLPPLELRKSWINCQYLSKRWRGF